MAAAEAAEESASSDCTWEEAGEVGSSTEVVMSADMMRCVQKRSERRREKGRRRERDTLKEMDFSKLRIMQLASSIIVQALLNQSFQWVLLFVWKDLS